MSHLCNTFFLYNCCNCRCVALYESADVMRNSDSSCVVISRLEKYFAAELRKSVGEGVPAKVFKVSRY